MKKHKELVPLYVVRDDSMSQEEIFRCIAHKIGDDKKKLRDTVEEWNSGKYILSEEDKQAGMNWSPVERNVVPSSRTGNKSGNNGVRGSNSARGSSNSGNRAGANSASR